MKLIKILNLLRIAIAIGFISLIIPKRFHLVENFEIFKNFWLFDLSELFVVLYLVIYLIQSRLELHEKETQIINLKALLNN